MNKLCGLVILAAAFVLVAPTSVLAGDYVCDDVASSPLSGAVIHTNFIVPEGGTCFPGVGVVFRQSVTVKQGGFFQAFAIT